MATRLFFVGVAGFVLGVWGAVSVSVSPFALWFLVVVTGALGALYLGKRYYVLLLGAVFFLGVLCGAWRTALVPHTLPEVFADDVGKMQVIEGRVVADPDIRETQQRLTVAWEQDGHATNVLAVAPAYPEVRYGQVVRIAGVVKPPEAFTTDGGRVFRYDRFLAKNGVYLIMQNASLERIGERAGLATHVRGALYDLKSHGLDALAGALPEPHAALAGGLILGGKQGLGSDLLNDFIVVGLVHIVVLSGYNVMIVAEFVMRICAFTTRRIAAVAGITTIVLFVLSAGAGAASIRAGIMASVAVFARATGRTYDALRALIVAGLLMVLAHPYTLVDDPGFQLSVVATAGLILGAPLIARRLHFIRSEFLRELVSATIAAQVSVLPLLLYQNGLLSLVALPANVLVLPFVPLAMLASALAALGAFIVPNPAPLIGMPAYVLLSYIVAVTEFLAQIPLAALSIPVFHSSLMVLAYAVLAYVWWRYK